jgi:hypothetical protein
MTLDWITYAQSLTNKPMKGMLTGPVTMLNWSFVTHLFHNGQPSHGGDRKFSEVMTSTFLKGILGLVVSLLATTLYS